jgi:hypothetical protein
MATLIAAVLTALLFTPVQQSTQTGTIAGRIRTANGSVAGIRVVAVDASDPAAVSSGNAAIVSLTQADANGDYTLRNIPPGRYFIMAGFLDAPTYYPGVTSSANARVVEIRAVGAALAMDFPLQRSVGVKVSGKVTRDPRASFYGDQLRIRLSPPVGPVAVETPVAKDGTFEFAKVAPGRYTARVFPGSVDYSTKAIEVGDRDIDDLQLSIPFTVNVGVGVKAEGVVPGIAVSFTSEAGTKLTPRPGINVSRLIDGSQELTYALPEGNYRVALAEIPEWYEVRSLTQGRIDLLKEPLKVSALDAVAVSVTLALKTAPPWVSVSGRLTTGRSGPPVRVMMAGPSILGNLEAQLESDGTFEFPRVPPGEYRLGLSPSVGSVPPRTLRVSNTNITNIELSVPRVRTLNGKISTEHESPFPRFRLVLSSANSGTIAAQTVSPRPDGAFSVTLPEGEFFVAADAIASGYRILRMTYGATDLLSTKRITVTNSDSGELNVVTDFTSPSPWVRVSGSIKGGVTRIDLSPDGSVRFAAPIQMTVGPDGTFEFPRIAPGQYTVRTFPADNLPQTITVEDKDIVNLEVIAPASRIVTGSVDMDGDAPMPRPNFSFVRLNGQGLVSARTTINSDRTLQMTIQEGEYQFRSVSLPENYRVVALTYGDVDLLKEPFVVSGDLHRLQVKIGLVSPTSRVRVSGHVSGASNLGAIPGRVVLLGEGLISFNAEIDANGNFSFSDVVSGTYTIQALAAFEMQGGYLHQTGVRSLPGSTMTTFPSSGTLNVAVRDQNIEGLDLRVLPAQRIAGRVVYENKTTPITTFALTLTDSTGKLLDYVRPDVEGAFTITVPESSYTVAVDFTTDGLLATPYQVKSIRRGQEDLLQSPLRLAGPSKDALVITVAPKSP